MLVGEAPGASEDEQGRPFVGRAGKLLDELLAEAGLARDDVFITNVVKARPPGNRDPKADEVAHHLPWLERQLALIRPRVVIPLGRHALAHFAPGRKITEVHGELLVAGERQLVPWLHPAAALRNPGLRETLVQDARALPGVLDGAGRAQLELLRVVSPFRRVVQPRTRFLSSSLAGARRAALQLDWNVLSPPSIVNHFEPTTFPASLIRMRPLRVRPAGSCTLGAGRS